MTRLLMVLIFGLLMFAFLHACSSTPTNTSKTYSSDFFVSSNCIGFANITTTFNGSSSTSTGVGLPYISTFTAHSGDTANLSAQSTSIPCGATDPLTITVSIVGLGSSSCSGVSCTTSTGGTFQ